MWKRAALAVAVVAATFVAYRPALDGPFLLDDISLLREPLVLRPLDAGLADWWAHPRPLATLTFALNHATTGLDPRGWHLTSLAIHLAAAALAYLLARRTLARAGLARPDGPAFAAAAVFALHPLQTQAVAYLSQRSESLASALYLAALLLLLRSDDAADDAAGDVGGSPARPRRLALLAGATLLHGAALLVKPIAATLPAAWLLHAALLPTAGERADPPWRRVARRLPAALPLLALSAAAAVGGVSAAAGSGHAGLDVPDLPPADYLATQLRALPAYLRLLAVPLGQCGDWNFPASRSFLEPAVLAGALFLGALLALAAWLAVRGLRAPSAAEAAAGPGSDPDTAAACRTAAFGILFFFLALLPSSSVVPLLDTFVEHRVYLAALGPFLAVAAGATWWLRRAAGPRARPIGAAVTALVLAALTTLTTLRTPVWSSALAFWEDAAAKAPGKGRVFQNLGDAYFSAGRPAEALGAFRRALQLLDDHTITTERLVENMVNALFGLDRVAEARVTVQGVLATRPGDPAMTALLSLVELVGERDDEAERLARAALARDPGQPVAFKVLGLVAAHRGDAQGALAAFREAVRLGSLDPVVWLELGNAEEFTGGRAAACTAYARAAALTGSGVASEEARRRLGRLGCR